MLPNPLICGFEVSWYALCQYGGVAVMLLFGSWYYKHGIKERFLLWRTTLLFWYKGLIEFYKKMTMHICYISRGGVYMQIIN